MFTGSTNFRILMNWYFYYRFEIEDLRIKAILFLKQSEDGNSVLIDRIENASFELPYFKVNMITYYTEIANINVKTCLS